MNGKSKHANNTAIHTGRMVSEWGRANCMKWQNKACQLSIQRTIPPVTGRTQLIAAIIACDEEVLTIEKPSGELPNPLHRARFLALSNQRESGRNSESFVSSLCLIPSRAEKGESREAKKDQGQRCGNDSGRQVRDKVTGRGKRRREGKRVAKRSANSWRKGVRAIGGQRGMIYPGLLNTRPLILTFPDWQNNIDSGSQSVWHR